MTSGEQKRKTAVEIKQKFADWSRAKERITVKLIHHSHLEMWGVEQKELMQAAVSNYKKLYRIKTEKIQDILAAFLREISAGEESAVYQDPVKIYVVTNHLNLYGAAAMLFPEEFRHIADDWGVICIFCRHRYMKLLLCQSGRSMPDSWRAWPVK